MNNIDQIVEWVHTARGGRRQLLTIMHERQACESEYGLCEREPPSEFHQQRARRDRLTNMNPIKRITTRSFRAELRAVVREFRVMVSHQRGVRRARLVKLPCALHIGCGENVKQGWVNVDFDKAADICLDVREPLPFPDDSVTVVYSEHFFEHLSADDGKRFLGECARVLQPMGRLSIGVPDAALILRDYVSGDREKWQRTRDRYHPDSCTTPMHSVNHFFRQGEEHKYAYDEETLTEMIRGAGFVDVGRRRWDPALDLPDRRDGTLYVDARKKS
jgi:predicted SAM-dependent methyltransferase